MSTRQFIQFIAFFHALVFAHIPIIAYAARGSITAEDLTFLSPPEKPAEQNEGRLKAEYDERFLIRKSKPAKLTSKTNSNKLPAQASTEPSEWNLRTNIYLQATTLPDSTEQPVFVDPTNVHFEYTQKNLYLQLGYFTLKWEGTDGINPMDIASIKNWSDPLDSKTRASAGIHIGDGAKYWDWEIAYIPKQTPTLVPGDESAWWPRINALPFRTNNVELRLPDDVRYKVTKHNKFDHALDSNFAIRLQAHPSFADMALAFYEGAAETPLLIPTLNVTPISVPPKEIYQLQSPIELTPTDYRVRTVAGFISKTIDSNIFRLSSRYDQPIGDDVKIYSTWSQQTVAGIEHSTELAGQSLIIILQGLWFHNPSGGSLVSVQDVFDKSVLVGVRAQLGDTWTVLISAIQSTHDGSSYASTEVTKTFENGWSMKGGIQFIEGPKNSLLGVLRDNDRATLEMTRAF